MRPRRLEIAEIALKDLRDIHDYIARNSERDADVFLDDLLGKIDWIARSGFSGIPRDHVSPGLKALPYRRRCIYFRIDEDTVRVLRVVHGARDVARLSFGTKPA